MRGVPRGGGEGGGGQVKGTCQAADDSTGRARHTAFMLACVVITHGDMPGKQHRLVSECTRRQRVPTNKAEQAAKS